MADKFGLPKNIYGWISVLCGLIGCTLYAIQLHYGILGFDAFDKSLISLGIIALLLGAIAFQYVHNRLSRIEAKGKNPLRVAGMIVLFGFVGICLLVMVINMTGMQMSQAYMSYANSRQGVWTGFRQLSEVTQEDVNSLQNWALGLRTMIKALFLTIPMLIVTWGALAMLTAESLSEADGALFAFVASVFFTIEIWMFKIVDVTLARLPNIVGLLIFAI